MKLSERGANLIAGFEGFRSCPYFDVDHYSIGFGSRSSRCARCISRAEAQAKLRHQVDETYGDAVNDLPGELNQNQFDALTSFVYNVGPGAIEKDTRVGQALRRKQWQAAADGMLAYTRAGGRVLQGLVNRRRAERRLFMTAPPPPPVRYSEAERRHLRQAKRDRPAAERAKAKEWLRGQARRIQTAARGEKDGWEKYDRGRRYQGLRRAAR